LLSVLLVSVGSDFYVATICLQQTVLNAAYGNQINFRKLSGSSIPNDLATCHDCSF